MKIQQLKLRTLKKMLKMNQLMKLFLLMNNAKVADY